MLQTSVTSTAAPRGEVPSGLPEPRFPDVVWSKGRGYVFRSSLNRYKAELLAAALGVATVEPAAISPDPLVPLRQVSAEIGLGRRTIGRRIKEGRALATAAPETSAA